MSYTSVIQSRPRVYHENDFVKRNVPERKNDPYPYQQRRNIFERSIEHQSRELKKFGFDTDKFTNYATKPNISFTNNDRNMKKPSDVLQKTNSIYNRQHTFTSQAQSSITSSNAPIRRTSREITSTKEFEDRATTILAEMRRQRRMMKMETVSSQTISVTNGARTGGWRETMRNAANKDENSRMPQTPPKYSYLSQKRSSISEFVGKVIRKLSVSKGDESQETEPKPHFPAQFNNPLDFILMKEEYLKKNPPTSAKVESKNVQDTSAGSDSMASVMDSLKKMVKKINPKREFPGDPRKDELSISKQQQNDLNKLRYEERMRKYQGASITPFNIHSSRWNSPGDNKLRRERIQTKVLSSIHQPQQIRINVFAQSCDIIEPAKDISQRVYPVTHWRMVMLAMTEVIVVLHSVTYRRADKVEMSDIIAQFNKTDKAKKKLCHAKCLIHGLNDPKNERYIFGLVTRPEYTWETVRPINVAVKKKTELFAPKSHGRASVSIDTLSCAVVTCPGTSGSTSMCQVIKWSQDMGCALFSCVGKGQEVTCSAYRYRPLVACLPIMSILDADTVTKNNQAVFTKCDRVPQSQLVQDILSAKMGTLSRISFHHPVNFMHIDVVVTIIRYLRTKKDLNRFKFKQEEFISRIVIESSGDDINGKDSDSKFLSYGTV